MKIGIVRHFKVDCKMEKYMNADDFAQYVEDYDISDVIKNDVYLGEDKWDKCYCSDMSRAFTTAKSIYKGEIEKSSLIREVKMYPALKLNIKLPASFWSVSARISWRLNRKSQLESRKQTRKRAKEFLNNIINDDKNENILIVSHGFFLITLIKELRQLGFKGNLPKKMKNGTLYILEK